MRFLVVYKESVYRASLHSHRRSFAAVERILRGFGIPFDRLIRGRAFGEDRYSLVISLGGDGTFLDAARYLKKVPIMGVNSAPGHSVGRFCPVNRSNLRVALNDFFGKRLTAKRIHRLNISLNGKTWKHPVLNDVLVCHAAPAAMSRYVLSIGKVREAQRSSGLWVSTAAGSTGALQSSSGRRLPLFSSRLEYQPRELFEGHGARYRLKGGVLSEWMRVKVTSQMKEGRIYVDGAHVWLPFSYGSRLDVFSSKNDLIALYPKGRS